MAPVEIVGRVFDSGFGSPVTASDCAQPVDLPRHLSIERCPRGRLEPVRQRARASMKNKKPRDSATGNTHRPIERCREHSGGGVK